jgi:hypothetical protein
MRGSPLGMLRGGAAKAKQLRPSPAPAHFGEGHYGVPNDKWLRAAKSNAKSNAKSKAKGMMRVKFDLLPIIVSEAGAEPLS